MNDVQLMASKVLSVEQLNRTIRHLVEGSLGVVWVRGEISNFKAHTSGHMYFSLKDAQSQVRAVMFRGSNSRLAFKPYDGLEVIIRGRISVYEPRGEYQIVCDMMDPVGAGVLQKTFEQLKEKLRKEGLFETTRKRPLPLWPKHIGIVTSPTGAAIRDMLNILNRRNRLAKVTLIPTLVQGEGASEKIIEAMNLALKALPDLDVLILGRGGGSIEDLWAFNNEKLARTISNYPIPVVSAVGHEIDFTIADFVADLRAPTPSAAAELVVKNSEDISNQLYALTKLLILSIEKRTRTYQHQLTGISARLTDPKRKLQDLMIRNDELFLRLSNSVIKYFEKKRMKVILLRETLPSPDQWINKFDNQIEVLKLRLEKKCQHILETKRSNLREQMSLLESLSPLRVLKRGYSITWNHQGDLLKSYQQCQKGDQIKIHLSEGKLNAQVMESSP